MTTDRVNPFARQEDPDRPNPPLKCTCPDDDCGCYVAVDDFDEQYAVFRDRLEHARDRPDLGFFVCVCGPSGSGKTSLINRCADFAKSEFADRGFTTAEIDLTGDIRDTMTIADRTRTVGEYLVNDLNRLHQRLFEHAPDPKDLISRHLPADGGRPALESVTRELAKGLRDKTAVIVLLPPTDQFEQLRAYWAGVSKRFLFFAESSYGKAADRVRRELKPGTSLRSICLETGFLKEGDGARFGAARMNINGKRVAFPDLDVNALENYIGSSMQIGGMQTLLWELFEEYRLGTGTCDKIIRAEEIARFMAGPEG